MSMRGKRFFIGLTAAAALTALVSGSAYAYDTVKDGVLTGRFLTRNCYGEEKVNRLNALYPNRQDYHLIAFGDSRGDKELLAFADESHFKPFR